MEMRTLLVDSSAENRSKLWNLLMMHRAFTLEQELETTEQAFSYIQDHYVDVVFINWRPADPEITSDGTFLSSILAQSHPHVQVVIYSDSEEGAYHALRNQCAGYLLTPFDPLAVPSAETLPFSPFGLITCSFTAATTKPITE